MSTFTIIEPGHVDYYSTYPHERTEAAPEPPTNYEPWAGEPRHRKSGWLNPHAEYERALEHEQRLKEQSLDSLSVALKYAARSGWSTVRLLPGASEEWVGRGNDAHPMFLRDADAMKEIQAEHPKAIFTPHDGPDDFYREWADRLDLTHHLHDGSPYPCDRDHGDAGKVEVVALTEQLSADIAEDNAAGLYVDIDALLSGDLVSPEPAWGIRTDGERFIYPEAVNVIFGPPETGKTLIASAIAADAIFEGGSVLWLDLDHNGMAATVSRFRSFGVLPRWITDRSRFRLALPEGPDQVEAVLKDAKHWKPDLVVVDSIAELLGLYGASNDSSDDFTRVNRATLAAFARDGASVVAIDHEAKGQLSRDYGAGGTMAKKRAVDGSYLRARVVNPFTPGVGGKAELSIVKDRHGAVRGVSPAGEKEPIATTFHLRSGEATDWKFYAPNAQHGQFAAEAISDIDQLRSLDPAPKSIYDVKQRMSWGSDRAKRAFEQYQAG